MKFGLYFPLFGLDTEIYEVNSYRMIVDIKFFSDHAYFFSRKKQQHKTIK